MESGDRKDVRHLEHDESEHRDKITRSKPLEVTEEKPQRYAEYEETVESELPELEEEEEVDRVEESRKRRQVILGKHKYKKLQLQNQVQPQTEVPENEEKASLPIDKIPGLSYLTISVLPNLLGSRDGGLDVDGADPLFSARKSPIQHRETVSGKTQGVEGLDGSVSKGKGDSLQVERSEPNDNLDTESYPTT